MGKLEYHLPGLAWDTSTLQMLTAPLEQVLPGGDLEGLLFTPSLDDLEKGLHIRNPLGYNYYRRHSRGQVLLGDGVGKELSPLKQKEINLNMNITDGSRPGPLSLA